MTGHKVEMTGQATGGIIMLFLIGFGLTVIGGAMMILYLNLVPAGLSWTSYWGFVLSQTECQLFFVGLILMIPGYYRILKRIK